MTLNTKQQVDEDALKSSKDQQKTKEKAQEFKEKVDNKIEETKKRPLKEKITNIDPSTLPTYRCREVIDSMKNTDYYINDKNSPEIKKELEGYFHTTEEKTDKFISKKVAQISDNPQDFYKFTDKSKKLTSLQAYSQEKTNAQKKIHEERLNKYITEGNQLALDTDYQPSIWRRITDSLKITPEFKSPRISMLEDDIRIEKSWMKDLDQDMKNIKDMDETRDQIVDNFIISETGKELAKQKKAVSSPKKKSKYYPKIKKPEHLTRQYSKEYSQEKRDQLAKEIKMERKERSKSFSSLSQNIKNLGWKNKITKFYSTKKVEMNEKRYAGKVEDISKIHNVAIVHGMSHMDSSIAIQALKSENNDFATKLKNTLANQPEIATYTISKGEKIHIAPQGIILKGGDIYYTRPSDALSTVDGKGKRTAGGGDIGNNFNEAIFEKSSTAYNELGVRNPEIAGIYIAINDEGKFENNIFGGKISAGFGAAPESEIHQLSKEYQIPVYGFKDGIPHEINFDKTNNHFKMGQAVTMNNILENKFKLPDEKKKNLKSELGDIYAFGQDNNS